MGQKINPFSFRLGIIKDWTSRWFPKDRNYKNQLQEDMIIRRVIKDRISLSGIVSITIERGINSAYRVVIKAAKPGLIIGRGGKGIDELTKAIEMKLKDLFRKERKLPNQKIALSLNVEELKRSEIAAQFVAQQIAWDLEKRMPGRRTIKKTMENIMQNREVLGAKIKLSGRIDGAEISRREQILRGKLPLQTLRADIDYGTATAFSTYGTVGVKVWIYRGEVFTKDKLRS